MGKKHLVFGDAHAHPDHKNDRADWLGQLILALKPDVVIDIGDTADMPSLSSYDKGTRGFVGRSYQKDIDAHNEFQDRVWHPIRAAKRKLPRRIRLIGNHEQRIERCLDLHPELEGTVGYDSLQLSRYYDDVIDYDGRTPGTVEVDGITYSHYFVSGVMGRPISGEHPAYTLLTKKFSSCTQGHVHTYDHCIRTNEQGSKLHGLVTGCYQDYNSEWAGVVNGLWWRGLFVKHNVEEGQYDLEALSLDRLRKAYGR